MRMNYLRSKTKSNTIYYKLGIALVVLVILFILRVAMASALLPVVSPVARGLWKIRNVFFADNQMANQSETVKIMEARLKYLETELGLVANSPSHILSSLSVSPYDTIIIDHGVNDGIKPGDLIVTGDGV